MNKFDVTPSALARSLFGQAELIRALVHRDVLGRYRGSLLGMLWSLFNPLFMLAVYTFVFSVVFKARWNASSDSRLEFALVLFAGLIVFNFLSECINKAPIAIISNVNYVKKVVFPLEIMPFVSVGSALFHVLISLAVWLLAYTVLIGMPHWTVILAPVMLLPLILMVLGLSWLLSSLGVYLRDVSQVTGVIVTVSMFLSPIFYPLEAIPEAYRFLIYVNPLTPTVEMLRAVLYWGALPELTHYLAFLSIAAVIAWLGFFWFQKTRKGFADVL